MFAEDFLTVRIGGRPGVPERLLLIGPQADGRVKVREWTSDSWNTPGADRDMAAGELLAQIEQAFASPLPVSEEMYKLRRWLSGC